MAKNLHKILKVKYYLIFSICNVCNYSVTPYVPQGTKRIGKCLQLHQIWHIQSSLPESKSNQLFLTAVVKKKDKFDPSTTKLC